MLSRTTQLTVFVLGLVVACSGQVGDPPQQNTNSNSNSNNNTNSNQPGSCNAGFELVNGVCQDIDECQVATTCADNATCANQPGAFTCTCNTGYEGDGQTCTPSANRCDDMPAILASAENGCVTCHDTTPGVEGGNLDLLSPGAGVRMLNRRSGNTSCRDHLLINAENPDDSLILKLVDPVRYAAWGDDACIGAMPFGRNGVSADDVTCFEEWVADVAANNVAPDPDPIPPFDPMPVESVVGKAKYILHGDAVTDAELAQVSGANGSLNRAGLRTVIEGWASTPEFENKVRGFLQLALQQYEINPRNQPYRDQFDPIGGDDVAIDRNAFYANLEIAFVHTAWNIVSSNGDFRQVATTRTWQVTTAILAALVYADRQNTPNGNNRFERFAHLTPADYNDWRNVRFTQAANANEVPTFANTAAFAQSLRSIGNNGTLPLRAPRVGFFNTPPFFESWETNDDNQFRVTTNQTLLTALDILFEAGDTTEQNNLNGLNGDHSNPDTACYQCHRLLDPMRLEFQNVYTSRYRMRNQVETELQPSFAFQGYTATPLTMDEFAQALVDHPRFPTAWVQKVCMWANSQRCLEDDPEFIRIRNLFVSSNYNFMTLLMEMFTSPLVTGAGITETHDANEYFVSIGRSNHFCVALQQRIRGARAERCAAEREANPDANPQVCQERANIGCNATGTTREMATLISSDAYGRGSREFIQESVSGPFNARAMTEMCTQLADREVGGGNRTFTQNDVNGSIDRMVRFVMGLPSTHPRYQSARDSLRKAYDIGRATPLCSADGSDVVTANADEVTCGFGLNAQRALYIPWILACSSPELAGQGL